MTYQQMRREIERNNKEFESAMRLLETREKRKFRLGFLSGFLSAGFLAAVFAAAVKLLA